MHILTRFGLVAGSPEEERQLGAPMPDEMEA